MITINKDRKAYIPESDRFIGYENDNLVETRLFEICDDELSNFHFKLDIAETLDIIDLEKTMLNDEKTVLLWKISSAAIGKGGVIRVQLRAFDNEGNKVWHSQIMDFIARESVNANNELNEEHILSEFEQVELRATNAASKAEQFASDAGACVLLAQGFSAETETAANSAREHCDNAGIYAQQAETFAEKTQADKIEAMNAKNDAVSFKEAAEHFSILANNSATEAVEAQESAKNYSANAELNANVAQAAKIEAVNARNTILDMGVSIETLSADRTAYVTKIENDGVLTLYFGIPKGQTGDKGESGYTPQKGTDYYTEAEIEQIKNEVVETANSHTDTIYRDIDAALDRILAIQDEHIGVAILLGEEEVVPLGGDGQ